MNTPAAAPATFWKRIWVGRDGVRAVWTIALFIVTAIAVMAVIGGIAFALHHPPKGASRITPLGTILNEAVSCCGILVATFVVSRVEKRPWLSYGLAAPHRLAHFWQGAFWGLAVLSALIGTMVLSGAAVIHFSGAGAASVAGSGLLWAVAFFLTAIFEESAFRGYLFFRLSRSWNPLGAAIVMSLLFGSVHLGNSGEGATGIIMVVAYGLMACLAVWRTQSLWWVFGLHAAWDWGETFLYGTADSGLAATGTLLTTHPAGPAWLSGGSVGPEGSVLVFPAMALFALLAIVTLPRLHPAQPAAPSTPV